MTASAIAATPLRQRDQQHQRYVQIAVRHPADHGNIAPTFREAGHRIAPIVVIQVDPRIVVLHVIVVHVVVHRHVWQVGHVEITEAFGEKTRRAR